VTVPGWPGLAGTGSPTAGSIGHSWTPRMEMQPANWEVTGDAPGLLDNTFWTEEGRLIGG
jgi:hypothetical protein